MFISRCDDDNFYHNSILFYYTTENEKDKWKLTRHMNKKIQHLPTYKILNVYSYLISQIQTLKLALSNIKLYWFSSFNKVKIR